MSMAADAYATFLLSASSLIRESDDRYSSSMACVTVSVNWAA